MIGADHFIHKLTDSRQRQHATQRYARGLSDIDMWNFDCFLADVIVAACDWHLSDCGMVEVSSPRREALMVIREGFAERNEFGVPNPPLEAWQLLIEYFSDFWD